MKYIKNFETLLFYSDEPWKKSPSDYKFNIGDYVTCNKIPHHWREDGFNEDTICIVCVVNIPDGKISLSDNPNDRYVIAPIDATNSDYEEWVEESEIDFAPEHKVAALKYNL